MSSLHAWVERIWWQDTPPPFWLRVIEPIYAAINRRNLDQRSAHAINPELPLISVGNITAGGSGKTPFVLWLAGALKDAGHQPVILCRGDGGKAARPVQVGVDADPAEVGDEALLLAQQSDCPVIAARDRIQATAMATHLGDLMILDDGFQYRQLKRACDIVLIPAEGIGNGHLIPAGPMREPASALQRADIIVRSGTDNAEPLTSAKEWRWQALAGPLTDVM
ncbi:MAG: tetraacyldisaccharide 4'-kinase, partial [Mariprofundaceae bacterium]